MESFVNYESSFHANCTTPVLKSKHSDSVLYRQEFLHKANLPEQKKPQQTHPCLQAVPADSEGVYRFRFYLNFGVGW